MQRNSELIEHSILLLPLLMQQSQSIINSINEKGIYASFLDQNRWGGNVMLSLSPKSRWTFNLLNIAVFLWFFSNKIDLVFHTNLDILLSIILQILLNIKTLRRVVNQDDGLRHSRIKQCGYSWFPFPFSWFFQDQVPYSGLDFSVKRVNNNLLKLLWFHRAVNTPCHKMQQHSTDTSSPSETLFVLIHKIIVYLLLPQIPSTFRLLIASLTRRNGSRFFTEKLIWELQYRDFCVCFQTSVLTIERWSRQEFMIKDNGGARHISWYWGAIPEEKKNFGG